MQIRYDGGRCVCEGFVPEAPPAEHPAVALLRELEWSGGENRLHLCPYCDRDKPGTHRVGSVFAADEGHAANCRLAILIGAPRREG